MYTKCMTFGDKASAAEVLATDDPHTQKAIGKAAKGYQRHIWAGVRQMVGFRGLMAKFRQNEELEARLLATGDAILVECSGSDRIWACGLHRSDNRRSDAETWKGDNILGFTLMEVRRMLREERRA